MKGRIYVFIPIITDGQYDVHANDLTVQQVACLNDDELRAYIFRSESCDLYYQSLSNIREIIKYALRTKKLSPFSVCWSQRTPLIKFISEQRDVELFRYILFDLGLNNVLNPETEFPYGGLIVDVVFMFYSHADFEQVLDILFGQGLKTYTFYWAIINGPADSFKYAFTLARHDVYYEEGINESILRNYGMFCLITIPHCLRKLCVLLACGYISHHDVLQVSLTYFPSKFVMQYFMGIVFCDSSMSRCILQSGFVTTLCKADRRDLSWLYGHGCDRQMSASAFEQEMQRFVKSTRTKPLSLQHQAANVIRTALRPNAIVGVKCLSLPSSILRIITLGMTEDNCDDVLL